MTSTLKQNFKALALLVFFILLFFSFPYLCSAHDHDGLHHHHDHDAIHHHDHTQEPPSYKYSREANAPTASEERRPKKQMSTSSLWLEALSSTLIISLAPFFILFFVPLNSRRDHEDKLKVLLSFASGGLLGDAFLHLIPHALEPHLHVHSDSHDGHSHDGHSHSHGGNTGTWVLGGILAFLIVEKCIRLIKGEHSHAHLLADAPESEEQEPENNEKPNENDNTDAMSESEGTNLRSRNSLLILHYYITVFMISDEILIAGYLNLAADFAHNFTDGLAIGASYLAGETVGLVTTITILFHEIPHEIGDFAILVQSGCSKRKVPRIFINCKFVSKFQLIRVFQLQAMLLQLLTAVGALSGTLVALASGGVGKFCS